YVIGLPVLAMLGIAIHESERKRRRPPASRAAQEVTKSAAAPVAAAPVAASRTKYLTTRLAQIKLVWVPAGLFLMGSPDEDNDAMNDERPQHEVRISRPFYLSVFEVSQAQYQAVMTANPSWFSSAGNGKAAVAGQWTAQHPVENVSWLEAVQF